MILGLLYLTLCVENPIQAILKGQAFCCILYILSKYVFLQPKSG